MAEAATTEFWRDIKPIAKVFKPGALPEAYEPATSCPSDANQRRHRPERRAPLAQPRS